MLKALPRACRTAAVKGTPRGPWAPSVGAQQPRSGAGAAACGPLQGSPWF